MKRDDTQFIDGRFTTTANDTSFDMVNPANEAVIGQLTEATEANVAAAVTAARRAFDTSSATPRTDRLKVLRSQAAEIDQRADDLAVVICDEVGTPDRRGARFRSAWRRPHCRRTSRY